MPETCSCCPFPTRPTSGDKRARQKVRLFLPLIITFPPRTRQLDACPDSPQTWRPAFKRPARCADPSVFSLERQEARLRSSSPHRPARRQPDSAARMAASMKRPEGGPFNLASTTLVCLTITFVTAFLWVDKVRTWMGS